MRQSSRCWQIGLSSICKFGFHSELVDEKSPSIGCFFDQFGRRLAGAMSGFGFDSNQGGSPPALRGLKCRGEFEAMGWHNAIVLAVAIVMAMGLVELLKVGFNLPRPYQPLNAPVVPQVTPKFETPSPINPGFPSGHTTTAFATATVILGRYRNWGYLFLGIAIGTGISMVHLGLHFPSDVSAGAFLGTLCGTFALSLAKHREDF